MMGRQQTYFQPKMIGGQIGTILDIKQEIAKIKTAGKKSLEPVTSKRRNTTYSKGSRRKTLYDHFENILLETEQSDHLQSIEEEKQKKAAEEQMKKKKLSNQKANRRFGKGDRTVHVQLEPATGPKEMIEGM